MRFENTSNFAQRILLAGIPNRTDDDDEDIIIRNYALNAMLQRRPRESEGGSVIVRRCIITHPEEKMMFQA